MTVESSLSWLCSMNSRGLDVGVVYTHHPFILCSALEWTCPGHTTDAIWTGETRPVVSTFIPISRKANRVLVVDGLSRICRHRGEPPDERLNSNLPRQHCWRTPIGHPEHIQVQAPDLLGLSYVYFRPETRDTVPIMARRTLDLNISGSASVDNAKSRQRTVSKPGPRK